MKKGLITSWILLLIVGLSTKNIHAQDVVEAPPKHAFFAEIGGNGLLFSINYNYRLGDKFGLRGGIGFAGGKENYGSSGFTYNNSIFTIPLSANLLLGKNGKYFELGAGITLVSEKIEFLEREYSPITGTLTFAFRYQPLGGGFMFNVGLTPIFTDKYFDPFRPGVGIGYCW